MQSAPIDVRATLELFRFYRPEVGLHRLLENAGIVSMLPRQIYQAVHNRPPDSYDALLRQGVNSVTETFIAALSSVEFQENLIAHVLRSFPEKRRLFFVHIPKTAGVDLATHLMSRYPSLSTTLLSRDLTPDPAQLFLAIKHVVLEMTCSDTIFISGHTHLGTYQRWCENGIRFQDRVFTVVREPLQQILSQLNYTLTRIFSDETPAPPDTAGWRREFHVENPDMRHSRDQVLDLARQILRHQGVVVPNVICSYLGGGSCRQALLQTAAHDLEVVELKQLDAWAKHQWNAASGTKLNSSEKFVTLRDLSPDDLEYAQSIVQEDTRYHQDVLAAYERHGGTSIRGSQIFG